MEEFRKEVEKILKTLPIGYYIKRNVDVKLTDDSCSYYDPMHDTIAISYTQLSKVIPNSTNLEEDVRCMLYHEVSHAFITPKRLRTTTIINIFEDERIESILRHYYLNVDFRNFVKRINHFNNEIPTTVDELFYQIVRYRIGPAKFVRRVSQIIKDYDYMNATTEYTYSYQSDVSSLYNDIEDYWKQLNRLNKDKRIIRLKIRHSNENNKDDNDNDNQNEVGSNEIDTNNDSEVEVMEDENEIEDDDTTTDDKADDNEDYNYDNVYCDRIEVMEDDEAELNAPMTSDEFDELQDELSDDYKQVDDFDSDDEFDLNNAETQVSATANQYESQTIKQDISYILQSYKSTSKMNASAINAYSGKFDPRSVIRKDYKYFVQQNRLGHVKAYSKMHLNLFIDCSGSFSENDLTVNKILKALSCFEKQSSDFTFDLISCGIGQKLRQKNDRIQESNDGTLLTEDIKTLFRQQQLPNTNNFNIVLYDGDMFTYDDYSHHFNLEQRRRIASTFDTNNTVVIVDEENERYLTHFTKANVINTKNYVDELYSHILTSLKVLTKT